MTTTVMFDDFDGSGAPSAMAAVGGSPSPTRSGGWLEISGGPNPTDNGWATLDASRAHTGDFYIETRAYGNSFVWLAHSSVSGNPTGATAYNHASVRVSCVNGTGVGDAGDYDLVVAGTIRASGTRVSAPVDEGSSVVMALRRVGDVYTGYIDGVEFGSYTDPGGGVPDPVGDGRAQLGVHQDFDGAFGYLNVNYELLDISIGVGYGTPATEQEATVIGSTSDAAVSSISSSSYADAREGTGTATVTAQASANTTNLCGQLISTFPAGVAMWQAFYEFDLASLPTGAAVREATVTITGTTHVGASLFVLEMREKDWGAAVAADDFVPGSQLGALTLLGAASVDPGDPSTEHDIVFTSSQLADSVAIQNAAAEPLRVVVAAQAQRLNDATQGRIDVLFADSTTGKPTLTVVYA